MWADTCTQTRDQGNQHKWKCRWLNKLDEHYLVQSDRMLLVTAMNNNTGLLPLHRHTPVVSVAAELPCVPQLEEDGFLKEKKTACVIPGFVVWSYSHVMQNAVGKMEAFDHGILPSSAPLSFCFFSSIVRSLSSCAFLYRYSRLSLASRRSFKNIPSKTLQQDMSSLPRHLLKPSAAWRIGPNLMPNVSVAFNVQTHVLIGPFVTRYAGL